MATPETKFNVKVIDTGKKQKVPKSVTSSIQGLGAGKMAGQMKREIIHCPLLEKDRPFLECFACESFIRRFKGEVHCAGIKATIFE